MNEEEVRKRSLIYEIEDEVWKLIKRRAWIFVLVFAVLGVSGIWAIVHYTVQQAADRPLKDLQKQLVHAEIQAEGAKRASATASAAADQVATNLGSLQESIQALSSQAKAVADQFTVVSQQIDAASKNAALRSQRDFNAAQQRIAALETLVKQIGDENAATRKATAEYAKQIAALETKVEREQKRFAENSAYTVLIHAAPEKKVLALELQTRLASAGFRAALSDLPVKGDKNTLTYQEKSENKAQEILALVKPILKNVETTKLRDIGTKLPLADWKDLKGGKSGGLLGVLMWPPEPNTLVLFVSG